MADTAGLDQIVARLYALPAEEFVAARAEAARAETDPERKAALKALRKPSKAAAAVNELVRSDPDAAAELVDLGAQLRSAQADMDGARLRTLSRQRRDLIQRLARRIDEVSTEPISPAVSRQVDAILQSVLADPQMAQRFGAAVVAGGADDADADPFALLTADMPPRERPTRSRPREREPAGRSRRPQSARRARPATAAPDRTDEREEQRQAEAERARLAQDADQAEAAAAQARKEAERAAAEVDDLQERLRTARTQAQRAQRASESAQRTAAAARHRADRAATERS